MDPGDRERLGGEADTAGMERVRDLAQTSGSSISAVWERVRRKEFSAYHAETPQPVGLAARQSHWLRAPRPVPNPPQQQGPQHNEDGSVRGRERAAVMYTLIQTVRLSGVDLQAWLADVIARQRTPRTLLS